MSTIKNATFEDSDSEQDPDFVPSDAESSSDDEGKGKEDKGQKVDVDPEEERIAKEKARASLWASFQSSLAESHPGSEPVAGPSTSTTQPPPKLVKVERKYRFAGEVLSEVIEVPEDSEEAKKWPLWKPSPPKGEEAGPTRKESETPPLTAPGPGTPSEASASTSTSKSSPIPPTPTSRPRPGPRKPKTQLTPLPSTSKPPKLTTLDKSALDWRAHVSASIDNDNSGLGDELELNRRSGGYLEKVAFLERVGSRREELYDQSRKRRRKG